MTNNALKIHELYHRLATIRQDLVAHEARFLDKINRIHPDNRSGALNLIHYCVLRSHDLREIQPHLASLGLASLALVEPSVQAHIDAVLDTLAQLAGGSENQKDKLQKPAHHAIQDIAEGHRDLMAHIDRLFGPQPNNRHTRIMVTMSCEGASNSILRQLVNHGMDCLRINTAHDHPQDWSNAILAVRDANQVSSHDCRILMDIPGPKIRTGPLPDGPEVLKVRPIRDALGQVIQPALVGFYTGTPDYALNPDVTIWLPVLPHESTDISNRHILKLRDTRGRKRTIAIREASATSFIGAFEKTIYFQSGQPLQLFEWTLSGKDPVMTFHLGQIPPKRTSLLIQNQDFIQVCSPEVDADATAVLRPSIPSEGPQRHRITCTLPSIIRDVKVDETIWFDDGKIGGIITETHDDYFEVQVTQIPATGVKLGSFKGINLPDSHIDLPALTPDDCKILESFGKDANLIGMSFIRSEKDVADLIDQLQTMQADHLGIILKIETRQAFENLPAILLQAMTWPKVGVMIARGDLAVEIGFERLAEAQDEIMWLCEAAHVPVIWATQVLENMAKQGLPSRAEVTDAAIAEHADCVMLNKGLHIVETMKYLDRILKRVERNTQKKGYLLRPLGICRTFLSGT